jgi:SAM-dependent methyltransferase
MTPPSATANLSPVDDEPQVSSSDYWDEETAQRYDGSDGPFAPEQVVPVVDALERLAEGGPALEFAIGTGRIAIPLRARGIHVEGIELSQPMVDVLRTKIAADDLPVAVGDMAVTRVPGEFALVYVVWNSLGNIRTQPEQVAAFRNAAAHLRPGGRFVVEIGVPSLRRLPPGQLAAPFSVSSDHLGFDTFDLVTQQGTSHHYVREADGRMRYGQSNFRYAWPAEFDLMAQIAGLELEHRWADWDASEFTSDSTKHVSVWRKPD